MTNKPRRSTLLTVMCILTFIGSAYGIISGALTYATASKIDQVQAEMKKANIEMKEEMKKDTAKTETDRKVEGFFGKMMEEATDMMSKENLQKQAMITICASVLTLLGAMLMWNLKILGFGIYTIAKIIEVGTPFVLYGTGLATGIGGAFAGFFALIFIVLYAFCIKEMRAQPEQPNIH